MTGPQKIRPRHVTRLDYEFQNPKIDVETTSSWIAMNWTPGRLRLALNFYPPYFFAGVRITKIAPTWNELHVSMKLRWFNRNAVGTHFGGSLYSMIDPHHMLLLMQLLGREYIVWDQSAEIVFRKPGRGHVRSIVRIDDETLAEIRHETKDGEAYRPEFELSILDDDDEVIATATKILYVRRKATSQDS